MMGGGEVGAEELTEGRLKQQRSWGKQKRSRGMEMDWTN